MVQFDTPMTAMIHAQRQKRVHRLGQKHDVDLIDLVSDCPWEERGRKLLEQKYKLRDIFTGADGSDDEGLAHEIHEARARKNSSSISEHARLSADDRPAPPPSQLRPIEGTVIQ